MQEHEVSYVSGSVTVRATLQLPTGGAQRRPAAILVHGWGSYRDDLGGFSRLAGMLAERGIASLRMDLRGCGESGVRGRIHPHSEWIEDVTNAISYLEQRPEIAPDRVFLIGMSVGGGVVCQVGAMDLRVRGIVALAPVADGEWWLRHLWRNQPREAWNNLLSRVEDDRKRRVRGEAGGRILVTTLLAKTGESARQREELTRRFPSMCREATYSSIESLLQFRPRLYAPCLREAPLYVIHSMKDESVPPEHAFELLGKAACPRRFEPVLDSPHSFWMGPAAREVMEKTCNCLGEWI